MRVDVTGWMIATIAVVKYVGWAPQQQTHKYQFLPGGIDCGRKLPGLQVPDEFQFVGAGTLVRTMITSSQAMRRLEFKARPWKWNLLLAIK